MSADHKKILLLIFVAAIALRLAFVFVTPAWEAPDEYAHYWVAEQVAMTGAHPVSRHTWPDYESYQPPLYYWMAAVFLKLVDLPLAFSPQAASPPAALVILRLLSVAIFGVTFWLVCRLLRRLDVLDTADRLWSLAFIAFLPTFVGNGASVTNDGLVTMFSAACLVVIWRNDWSGHTALLGGMLAGLALLTKWNAIVLVPIVVWRAFAVNKGDPKKTVSHLSLAAIGWFLPAAVLFSRNLIQYGSVLALNPGESHGFGLTLGNLIRAVRNLTWSFWLAFGGAYQIKPVAGVYFMTALPLMLAALAGWWRAAPHYRDIGRTGFFAITTAGLASLAFTLSYPPGEMTSWGKNLFVVLPLIAVPAAIGWRQVSGRLKELVPSVAVALMLTGCFWGLWRLRQLSAG